MIIDLSKLQELRTLIVSMTAWQDWCATTDTTELTSRIVWPLAAGSTLLGKFPIIALEAGPASWRNEYGYDSSANFLPEGMIKFKLWAEDATPEDPTASYEAFANKSGPFVEELVDKSHDGPLIIGDLTTTEFPVVHSHQLETESTDPPHWMGMLNIPWGLRA